MQALQRLIDIVRGATGPLAIRGGGSKDFYGGAITGTLLPTSELNGITSYEPSELVVTALAGTPLAVLEAALAERGQALAFEPPRFGAGAPGGIAGGTVGGMVAAGLAGPSRATAGGVRDHLLGAVLVNGRGELLRFGGQVMKNVAGYDVSRLLAGSMGVLGVIAEVSLKVLPLPPARRTLELHVGEAEAITRLNRWGGQPLPIDASAWRDGRLYVRLSGARAAVDAAARTLGGDELAADTAQTLWRGKRDHTGTFHHRALDAVEQGARWWRVAVPSTTPPLALEGDTMLEHGGALRWLVSAADPAQVRRGAAAAGGHALLFRALDKSPGVFGPADAPLPPAVLRVQRALKQAFDPRGIFNPGRMNPIL